MLSPPWATFSYIMFADYLCIIAESADELQTAINSLANYCSQNGLRINASKTKCMVFYCGRPPTCSFTLENTPLESVNEFTYLGFQFTTQLSFSAHLLNITTKANSRCLCFASLPVWRCFLNWLMLTLVSTNGKCLLYKISKNIPWSSLPCK